jgi:hypothetical protein
MRMEWVRNRAASREFERFVAEASDPLLRTGFLMTGNAKDAENLSRTRCYGWRAAGAGCGRWTIRLPMPAGS